MHRSAQNRDRCTQHREMMYSLTVNVSTFHWVLCLQIKIGKIIQIGEYLVQLLSEVNCHIFMPPHHVLWLFICLSVCLSLCASVSRTLLLTRYLDKYWTCFHQTFRAVHFGTRMNASSFGVKGQSSRSCWVQRAGKCTSAWPC